MIMEHGQRDRLKGGGAGGGDVHWRRNDAPSSGRQANFFQINRRICTYI